MTLLLRLGWIVAAGGLLVFVPLLGGCGQGANSGTRLSACGKAIVYLMRDAGPYRHVETRDISKEVPLAVSVTFDMKGGDAPPERHQAICYFSDSDKRPGFRFSRVKIADRLVVLDRKNHLNFQLVNSKW